MTNVSEVDMRHLDYERDDVGTLVEQARDLGQDSDPRDLLSWGDDLSRHQTDAPLMAALFDEVGPEETARLLRLTTFAADRSQTYPAELAATLGAFKAALSAGSRMLADARGFADELGRWLLPTELDDAESADLAANGGLPLVGPAALAQILRGTSFGSDFLAGLAERVEHFEQSGKVDPADYYRRMTPSRFDDYRARDIAGLLGEQRQS